MELVRTGVIYAIKHFEKVLYIGQTVNLDKRINTHRRKLFRGDHSLKSLQKYFNGVENKNEVLFEIIEKNIAIENLSIREKYYFDFLQPICFGSKPSDLIIYVDRRSPSGKRNCKICSKPFEINSQKQIYCSDECYYVGRKRSHTCKNCLKNFETFSTKSEYCSLKCLYSDSKYSLKCILCECLFNSSTLNSKYCSNKECVKNRFFYTLKCSICSNAFESKNKKARFCSSECRKLGRKRFDLNCKVCHERFQSSKEWSKYCSSKCRNYFSNLKKD